jgi:hypothetical protein
MDLFNPMVYSIHSGAYDLYRSVYPPINFLILKVIHWLGNGSYSINAFEMRLSSPFVIMIWLGLYFSVPIFVLNTKIFKEFLLQDRVLFYFLIVFSFPMLFALERGNLILLALIPFAIALSSKTIAREFSIAILINLKPYLVTLIFMYLLKSEWKKLFQVVLIGGVIFIISGLIFDSQYFLKIFSNIVGFQGQVFSPKGSVTFSSSIAVFQNMFQSLKLSQLVYSIVDVSKTNFLIGLISLLKWGLLFISLGVIYIKRKFIGDKHLLVYLLLLCTNFTEFFGGYIFILYFVFMPILLKISKIAVFLSFLLFLNIYSGAVFQDYSYYGSFSFLSLKYVDSIQYSLDIGFLLRPILNFIIATIILYCFYILKEIKTP